MSAATKVALPQIGWRIRPVEGMMFTVLATGIAVMLVPDNVEPAGALRWSSLVLVIGMITVPGSQVLKAPASLFHPVNVVAVSPVYWLLLDMLQGAYPLLRIDADNARWAFLLIGLFSSCVWIGSMGKPWRAPGPLRHVASVRLTSRQVFAMACVAFILSFLRFAIPSNFNPIMMLEAFGKGRWETPWGRGAIGGWDSFLDHMGYFGYLLPSLTALLARKVGWRNQKTIICALFACVIAALFSTNGGRRIIGVMFGSGMVVWYLSARTIHLRQLLVVAGLCAALLAVMQAVLISRNVGFSAFFDESKQDRLGKFEHLHVDDNFLRVCQLVQIIPDHQDYVREKWLIWLAIRPIPRVLWPGKPIDPGFTLAGYLGVKDTSFSTSLIGEAYMAFGVIGVAFFGWLFGRLAIFFAAILEQQPSEGGLITLGAGLLALFGGMRSGIDLILLSYVLLAWIAVMWLYQRVLGGQLRTASTRV